MGLCLTYGRVFRALQVLFILAITASTSACGKDLSTPIMKDPDQPFVGEDPELPYTPPELPNRPDTPDPEPPSPPPQEHRPTKYCAQNPDGSFSSDRFEGGEAKTYKWGNGGGCIMRPLREVWAVSANQPVMKWNDVTRSSYTRGFDLPSPHVVLLFNVHYEVDDFITVKWDMSWSHSLQRGTSTKPEKILITYAKYNGTSYIEYWEGSIFISQVTPEVTSLFMQNQIDASRTSVEDAVATVAEVFHKLRTQAPAWQELP